MRAAFVILCLLATPARAEPWYRGEHGSNRILHLSITAAGLALYPATTFMEGKYAGECRWCGGPNVIDRGVRDALVWDEPATATELSDASGYLVSPTLCVGLVLAGTLDTPSWALAIDDLVPVFESMVVTEFATRALKIATARQRPYAHFTGPRSDDDDNLSFASGHASRAFAFATSAGMIARRRGYKSEPYIWAGGLTVAAATAYFRIAGDKHYLSDVLVGSALGVTAGLTVPLLMRRSNVDAVVTSRGVAITGHW